jgi:hypothetical protein
MALMPLESSTSRIGVDIAIVVLSGTLTLGTNLKIVDQQMQSLIEEGIRKVVWISARSPMPIALAWEPSSIPMGFSRSVEARYD